MQACASCKFYLNVLSLATRNTRPRGRLSEENETLRWPTNLDREGIVRRLVKVRDAAQSSGLPMLASLYAEVDGMSSSQIGASVIAGISMVQEKPEHQDIALQLAMVAMNLKNLKS